MRLAAGSYPSLHCQLWQGTDPDSYWNFARKICNAKGVEGENMRGNQELFEWWHVGIFTTQTNWKPARVFSHFRKISKKSKWDSEKISGELFISALKFYSPVLLLLLFIVYVCVCILDDEWWTPTITSGGLGFSLRTGMQQLVQNIQETQRCQENEDQSQCFRLCRVYFYIHVVWSGR